MASIYDVKPKSQALLRPLTRALARRGVTPNLVTVSAVVLSFAAGAGAFVGDVNTSALKRDLHVKDSGTLLPGHGGVLDRVDSLTYTAPLLFHYVYWLFLFHTHGAVTVPGP